MQRSIGVRRGRHVVRIPCDRRVRKARVAASHGAGAALPVFDRGVRIWTDGASSDEPGPQDRAARVRRVQHVRGSAATAAPRVRSRPRPRLRPLRRGMVRSARAVGELMYLVCATAVFARLGRASPVRGWIRGVVSVATDVLGSWLGHGTWVGGALAHAALFIVLRVVRVLVPRRSTAERLAHLEASAPALPSDDPGEPPR